MASFLKGIAASVVISGSVASVGGALHYKDEILLPGGPDPNPRTVTRGGLAHILDVLNSQAATQGVIEY